MQILLAENALFNAYSFLPHTKEKAGIIWDRAFNELHQAKEDHQKSQDQDILDQDRATDEGMPEFNR